MRWEDRVKVEAFDRVVLAVPDLAQALQHYAALFTVRALPVDDATAWLALGNTVLELRQRPLDSAAIEGVVLRTADAGVAAAPWDNPLGLSLALCDGSASARFRAAGQASCAQMRVDHLVLRTAQAETSITLFRDRLGMRLALDQNVPAWGGRMLFFRAGKMTLEVIVSPEQGGDVSEFWGIAYHCDDIDALCARLDARGVARSPVREGRKPGTRVASLKSHDLGIPTLLIAPA
ncbi:MAG: hypothetical protein CME59_08350 [Halioglobus sp.]|nr:hypothetical protein [Halioglobus sp.]